MEFAGAEARAAVVDDSFYRRAWAPRILGSGPPAVSLSPTSSRIVSSSDDELRGVRRGEQRREACDEARVRLGAQDEAQVRDARAGAHPALPTVRAQQLPAVLQAV